MVACMKRSLIPTQDFLHHLHPFKKVLSPRPDSLSTLSLSRLRFHLYHQASTNDGNTKPYHSRAQWFPGILSICGPYSLSLCLTNMYTQAKWLMSCNHHWLFLGNSRMSSLLWYGVLLRILVIRILSSNFPLIWGKHQTTHNKVLCIKQGPQMNIKHSLAPLFAFWLQTRNESEEATFQH